MYKNTMVFLFCKHFVYLMCVMGFKCLAVMIFIYNCGYKQITFLIYCVCD